MTWCAPVHYALYPADEGHGVMMHGMLAPSAARSPTTV